MVVLVLGIGCGVVVVVVGRGGQCCIFRGTDHGFAILVRTGFLDNYRFWSNMSSHGTLLGGSIIIWIRLVGGASKRPRWRRSPTGMFLRQSGREGNIRVRRINRQSMSWR